MASRVRGVGTSHRAPSSSTSSTAQNNAALRLTQIIVYCIGNGAFTKPAAENAANISPVAEAAVGEQLAASEMTAPVIPTTTVILDPPISHPTTDLKNKNASAGASAGASPNEAAEESLSTNVLSSTSAAAAGDNSSDTLAFNFAIPNAESFQRLKMRIPRQRLRVTGNRPFTDGWLRRRPHEQKSRPKTTAAAAAGGSPCENEDASLISNAVAELASVQSENRSKNARRDSSQSIESAEVISEVPSHEGPLDLIGKLASTVEMTKLMKELAYHWLRTVRGIDAVTTEVYWDVIGRLLVPWWKDSAILRTGGDNAIRQEILSGQNDVSSLIRRQLEDLKIETTHADSIWAAVELQLVGWSIAAILHSAVDAKPENYKLQPFASPQTLVKAAGSEEHSEWGYDVDSPGATPIPFIMVHNGASASALHTLSSWYSLCTTPCSFDQYCECVIKWLMQRWFLREPSGRPKSPGSAARRDLMTGAIHAVYVYLIFFAARRESALTAFNGRAAATLKRHLKRHLSLVSGGRPINRLAIHSLSETEASTDNGCQPPSWISFTYGSAQYHISARTMPLGSNMTAAPPQTVIARLARRAARGQSSLR